MFRCLHLSLMHTLLVVLLLISSQPVAKAAQGDTTATSSGEPQSSVIPLPGSCGTGLPPTEGNAACCLFGYVFIDGEAVSGALVTVASAYGSIETWTQPGPDSPLPYYRLSLSQEPLRVQAGTAITIRAQYNSFEHTVTHTALAGAQQIDVTLPRNHSDDYLADLQVWHQGDPGVFLAPSGVAVDGFGRVYTLDRDNARVQVFTSDGRLMQQWGTLGSQPGQFANPNGIAIDLQGIVYVADSGNNRIQTFSSTGAPLRSWSVQERGGVRGGSFWDVAIGPDGRVYTADSRNSRIQVFSPTGKQLDSWDGGDDSILNPKGLTVDAQGNVYVADTDHNRVQKFTSDGNLLATVGSYGLKSQRLSLPQDVAVDQAGRLYILDTGHSKIHVYAPDGTWLDSWGSKGSGLEQLHNPERIAVAPDGTLYVADTLNMRVQHISAEGNTWASWAKEGDNNGQLSRPQGVAVGSDGTIYVVDRDHHQVQLFSRDGAWLGRWGSEGSLPGQFQSPGGISIGADGSIYVADTGNNRVQKFSQNGTPHVGWGEQAGNTYQMAQPAAVAVGGDGAVYVADTGNHRVLKLNSQGELQGIWGSYGSKQKQFDSPRGIAVDPTGDVYVADSGNHRIQVLDSRGEWLVPWGVQGYGDGQMQGPHGIAVDDAFVYVVDSYNNRVHKFTKQGVLVLSWGDLDVEMGYLYRPAGLGLDSAGRIYVADSLNNRIQRFRPMRFTHPIATVVAASARHVSQGQPIELAGMGSDSDETGSIARYSWFLDGDATPFATTPRATLQTTLIDPGRHVITFQVYDTEGEQAAQSIAIEVGSRVTSGPTTWTFLLYLDGDNDTAPFLNRASALGALYRLEHSAPNASVRVVALYDGPQLGGGDSARYVVEPNGQLAEEPLGEVDMGDPQTLIDFVQWGKQHAPADAYYLAIADHANGLDGIAWDATTGPNEHLTNADIRQALLAITAGGAEPLDVLHFDGCLMGLMENAYQVRGLARYLVSSENLAWSAFAYERYRSAVGPETTASELAGAIVDQYAERVGGASLPYTIAALDMALLDEAARKTDALAVELTRYALASPANAETLLDVRAAAQKLDSNGDMAITGEDEYVDLAHWAKGVQQMVNDSAAQQAAGELRQALARLVLRERHMTQAYRGVVVDLDRAGGVGIYYPPRASARTYQTYIQGGLRFAADTAWDEFLSVGLAALPFDGSDLQPAPVAPLPFTTTYVLHLPVLQR